MKMTKPTSRLINGLNLNETIKFEELFLWETMFWCFKHSESNFTLRKAQRLAKKQFELAINEFKKYSPRDQIYALRMYRDRWIKIQRLCDINLVLKNKMTIKANVDEYFWNWQHS